MITNELIQELITCPKIVTSAERKDFKLEYRHYLNNLTLESKNGFYKYKMILRLSDVFIENFSVGLVWINSNQVIGLDKSHIILLRCNGCHDGKKPIGYDIHHSYHIHEITLEDFNEKRFSEPSKREITEEYSTFFQAISYFLKKCDIINI